MSNKEVNNWMNVTKLLDLSIVFFALLGISFLFIIIFNPIYDYFERTLFAIIPISALCFVLIITRIKLKFKYISQRNIGIPLENAKNLITNLFNERNIKHNFAINQRGIILPIPYLIKTSQFEVRLIQYGESNQIHVHSYNGTLVEHNNILAMINSILIENK